MFLHWEHRPTPSFFGQHRGASPLTLQPNGASPLFGKSRGTLEFFAFYLIFVGLVVVVVVVGPCNFLWFMIVHTSYPLSQSTLVFIKLLFLFLSLKEPFWNLKKIYLSISIVLWKTYGHKTVVSTSERCIIGTMFCDMKSRSYFTVRSSCWY